MPWVEMLHCDVDDLRLFDAHVHIGLHDPAGLLATAEDALGALEQVDSRALIFPLKGAAGYGARTGRTPAPVEAPPARLRALCRPAPAEDPLGEAQRCLDAG